VSVSYVVNVSRRRGGAKELASVHSQYQRRKAAFDSDEDDIDF